MHRHRNVALYYEKKHLVIVTRRGTAPRRQPGSASAAEGSSQYLLAPSTRRRRYRLRRRRSHSVHDERHDHRRSEHPAPSMTDTTNHRSERGREQRVAVIVTVIGVAHFLVPRIFDPINRVGFAEHARMFTYINGAIETTIGVMMANPRMSRQLTIVSACYVIHLTSNIVRNQVRIRHGGGHGSRWLG